MMYQYPFGEKLKRVKQLDESPKKVFILGVYASAVHAKWIDINERIICKALAVASEPYIFWDGNEYEAQNIIGSINIPTGVGKLEPADSMYNGPSGRILNEKILGPLGLTRENSWLCDLLPESRLNKNQQIAIDKHYNPLIKQYNLPKSTVPIVNNKYCDDARRKEITNQILASEANSLILLGDIPIEQYLKYVTSIDFKNLRDYTKKYGYGKSIELIIDGHRINIIPLAHPRQIGQLGKSNSFWYNEHKKWEKNLIDFNA